MFYSYDRCPHCGSNQLTYDGEFVCDDGFILLDTQCMSCNAEWFQRYRFDGNVEITTPTIDDKTYVS